MIELADNEIYVTYLKKNHLPFRKEMIKTHIGYIRPMLNKPQNAWWGSPFDADYGWKEWCFCNDYETQGYDWKHPILWRLQRGSKILKIDIDDVINPQTSILNNYLCDNKELFRNDFDFFPITLNFRKMLEESISAVQLMDGSIGHRFINKIEEAFNSWDCESIVVLDESKIEIV